MPGQRPSLGDIQPSVNAAAAAWKIGVPGQLPSVFDTKTNPDASVAAKRGVPGQRQSIFDNTTGLDASVAARICAPIQRSSLANKKRG